MIVGLGNPGRLYRNSRHNFGSLIIEALAKEHKSKIDNKDYSARWGKVCLGNEEIVLANSLAYMNLSGDAVGKLVRKFRIRLENVLVVLDDVNLSWGKIRFRKQGSAGGHNGLKSIIEVLGTNEFPRLRLGIAGGGRKNLSNYVLAKFSSWQKKDLAFYISHIVETIEVFVKDGIDSAMNKFNKVNIFEDSP